MTFVGFSGPLFSILLKRSTREPGRFLALQASGLKMELEMKQQVVRVGRVPIRRLFRRIVSTPQYYVDLVASSIRLMSVVLHSKAISERIHVPIGYLWYAGLMEPRLGHLRHNGPLYRYYRIVLSVIYFIKALLFTSYLYTDAQSDLTYWLGDYFVVFGDVKPFLITPIVFGAWGITLSYWGYVFGAKRSSWFTQFKTTVIDQDFEALNIKSKSHQLLIWKAGLATHLGASLTSLGGLPLTSAFIIWAYLFKWPAKFHWPLGAIWAPLRVAYLYHILTTACVNLCFLSFDMLCIVIRLREIDREMKNRYIAPKQTTLFVICGHLKNIIKRYRSTQGHLIDLNQFWSLIAFSMIAIGIPIKSYFLITFIYNDMSPLVLGFLGYFLFLMLIIEIAFFVPASLVVSKVRWEEGDLVLST